jgi:hypothetical protein
MKSECKGAGVVMGASLVDLQKKGEGGTLTRTSIRLSHA